MDFSQLPKDVTIEVGKYLPLPTTIRINKELSRIYDTEEYWAKYIYDHNEDLYIPTSRLLYNHKNNIWYELYKSHGDKFGTVMKFKAQFEESFERFKSLDYHATTFTTVELFGYRAPSFTMVELFYIYLFFFPGIDVTRLPKDVKDFKEKVYDTGKEYLHSPIFKQVLKNIYDFRSAKSSAKIISLLNYVDDLLWEALSKAPTEPILYLAMKGLSPQQIGQVYKLFENYRDKLDDINLNSDHMRKWGNTYNFTVSNENIFGFNNFLMGEGKEAVEAYIKNPAGMWKIGHEYYTEEPEKYEGEESEEETRVLKQTEDFWEDEWDVVDDILKN